MNRKRKNHEKTCPHCAFLHASRRQFKKFGSDKAKVEAINSARKIASVMFRMMSPAEQTQFIKDISSPQPDFNGIMETIKDAIEAMTGGKVKVTEH
jgi:hypothetical protein